MESEILHKIRRSPLLTNNHILDQKCPRLPRDLSSITQPTYSRWPNRPIVDYLRDLFSIITIYIYIYIYTYNFPSKTLKTRPPIGPTPTYIKPTESVGNNAQMCIWSAPSPLDSIFTLLEKCSKRGPKIIVCFNVRADRGGRRFEPRFEPRITRIY